MPHQNRVLATGEIIKHPSRGLFMGNRGILHDEVQSLGRARWRHKAWVTCVLKHKDWHRQIMQPGHYTELFFLDEAVAFAAGHRPCALCRRADYCAFVDALDHKGSAKDLDRALHAARVIPRSTNHLRYTADIKTLPSGTVIWREAPYLITDTSIRQIHPDGYAAPTSRPTSGQADVLTPSVTVKALAAGYRPHLHESAKL
ncbi:MAG: hypothetical protein HKP37_06270 [Boseongicola sp.]|nr:hypothetical protein [Boseongicola sp.]